MRRTALAVLLLVAACSSTGQGGQASSASSGSVTSATSATGTSGSTGSDGATTTADPALVSDLDRAGATAFLTLFADGLRKRDPTLTQAQVDCIPGAVLDRLTPAQLFALVDRGLGALDPADVAKVGDALRACQLTDAQVASANLG